LIDKRAKEISKKNHKFERVVIDKVDALEVFKHNPFKVQLIKTKVPEGGKCSLYIMGSLVDLCTGPHVPSSSYIKAFQCTKVGSSYWLAKNDNDNLQRMYAIAFPNGK